MTTLTDTQAQFLKIALGLDPAGDAAPSPAPLQSIWNKGKETADASIAGLQSKLKGLKHPALDRIAEFGLNGITEGNQVAMAAALLDYSRSSGQARVSCARKLLQQAETYKDFLNKSPMVELCESNPFNVPVDIKGPMIGAIAQIRTTIARDLAQ